MTRKEALELVDKLIEAIVDREHGAGHRSHVENYITAKRNLVDAITELAAEIERNKPGKSGSAA